MATIPDTPETEPIPGSLDAMEEAIYYFDLLSEANTLAKQAHAFSELSNAMDDLRSFHPGYDVRSGTMPWDREDEV